MLLTQVRFPGAARLFSSQSQLSMQTLLPSVPFTSYSEPMGLLGGGGRGRDIAQMVGASDRHAADSGLIPRCGKVIFFPESTFSADSLSVSVHPHVQSHALTSVRTIKIL